MAAAPMGIQRSRRPLPITSTAPASRSMSSRRSLEISVSRPGVSQSMYNRARLRVSRKRCAGAVARAGSARVRRIQHLVLGDHRDRLLIQAGRLYQLEGVAVRVFPLHQPVEEPVKEAVLDVDVALGQLFGFGVGPLSEPPGTSLETREVILDVGDGDFAHARPPLLLLNPNPPMDGVRTLEGG